MFHFGNPVINAYMKRMCVSEEERIYPSVWDRVMKLGVCVYLCLSEECLISIGVLGILMPVKSRQDAISLRLIFLPSYHTSNIM